MEIDIAPDFESNDSDVGIDKTFEADNFHYDMGDSKGLTCANMIEACDADNNCKQVR